MIGMTLSNSSSSLSAGIVICTLNRPDDLVACLHSIASQTRPVDQLIVVDSSEPRMDTFPAFNSAFSSQYYFPDTQLDYLHTERGLTLQRNRGIARANADIVFFFDDDVVLMADYIAKMMQVFEAHPEYMGGMGTIQGVTVNTRDIRYILQRLFYLQRPGGSGRLQKSGLPTHSYGRPEFLEVDILSGCSMAYRADVLQDFAFDEALSDYSFMEDVDFSYRVSRNHKLFYNPEAVLIHNKPRLPDQKIAARYKMYLINHHYLFFKNVYPSCRSCIFYYLWATLGLLVLSFCNRNPSRSLRWAKGWLEGVWDIVRGKGVART